MTITRYHDFDRRLEFQIQIYYLRNMELRQRKHIMIKGKITSHGQVITPP